MLLIFAALPLLFLALRPSLHIFAVLWGMTLACLVSLLVDPTFDRRRLWNAGAFREHGRGVFLRFALVAPVIAVSTAVFMPDDFLSFPRARPLLWAAVMLLYPWLSVYPQGILYRAFVFHRYRPIFGERGPMIVASAMLFALSHVVFGNWIAVVLTALGGLLFARTYHRSRSLLVCQIEHALYGCLLFTIGLGRSIYYQG